MSGAQTQPIKVGIAGLGRAGWGMQIPEMAKRPGMFQVVAACDPSPERRQRMAETHHCPVYADIRELAADPSVEMVSVASLSTDHARHALQCLRAGKLVFLEKPIALTYADARALAREAARRPGRLFLRHNHRFEPHFQHVREIIASGILGEVYEVKLHRHGYQRRADWQTLKDFGGGQLNNWGPHIVDHALRFLDSPVADLWSSMRRVAAVGDAEDHLTIVLRGRNGRVVTLEISGGVALPEPEYVVFGSRGALSATEQAIHLKYLDPGSALGEVAVHRESPPPDSGFPREELPWKEETIPVHPALPVEMDRIWEYLYDSVRGGKPFPITTEEAVEVVRITELARKKAGW
jgi:scyllo-inositol 2-dehydrogenase (NADP+)